MDTSKYNPLSAEERYIIESKGTERPFTGEYDDFYETGTYTCRRCNAELYRSVNKFGPPSTKRYRGPSISYPTPTVIERRLSAVLAADI